MQKQASGWGDLERIDDSTPRHYHSEHMARYAFVQDRIRDTDRVLDLGCGTGYATRSLSERAEQVVAVDISSAAVEQARSVHGQTDVQYAVARGESLPFADGSFDRVISFEVIEHLAPENQLRYLAEIDRILCSAGVAFLSTPNRRFTSGKANPYHMKEFYLRELEDLLKGRFGAVSLFGQRCTSPVARVYNGRTAAIVRRIKEALRIQFLLPHWAKRGWEFLLTGSTMTEVDVGDFEFVDNGIDECKVFLAICDKRTATS